MLRRLVIFIVCILNDGASARGGRRGHEYRQGPRNTGPDLTIQESGTGMGLQIESILSYLITDQLSVGIGGRYWAMWATKDAVADYGDCSCQVTQPARTDRFGAFVQLNYTGLSSLFEGFN